MNKFSPEHAALTAVASHVLDHWPEHAEYLSRSFAAHDSRDLAQLDTLARQILILMGNQPRIFAASYRIMCNAFLEEEIFFSRHGRYRLSTHAQAERDVYANTEFMGHYMRGLLLSQLLWSNHAKAFLFYQREFLGSLTPTDSLLEVGPGHGLLLARASERVTEGELLAIDVSAESLRQTAESMAKLSSAARVSFRQHNILSREVTGSFDAIVLSELLEHLEDPLQALRNLSGAVAEGGKIYINIPINSPAPDHIFLWRTPQEVKDLLIEAGFRVESSAAFPMVGRSLEQALRQRVTVTCCAIARPARDRPQ